MDTIRTIPDLLTCNGSVRSVTVSLIPSDRSLIAAAPGLLSIVQRFVALPSGAWHPERHAAEEAELMQEAKAAIARATGDTP